MKIAVWHNLPSGGGKRALYDHVRGLRERGHEVEAWCPSTADQTFLSLNELVVEHVLPFEPQPRSLAWLLPPYQRVGRQMRAMEAHCQQSAEEIARGGFDVLLVNPCKFFRVSPIGRFSKLPRVLYLQEPYRELYEAMPRLPWLALPPITGFWFTPREVKKRLRDLIQVRSNRVQAREEQRNAQAFDRILVNSLFSRESILRAYGLDARVCYLGVDVTRFVNRHQVREDFIVGIGALIDHKNIRFVLEALAQVRPPRPRLVWIGNASNPWYLRELRQFAESAGVDFEPKVGVTDDELVDILNRALLMAYAPRLEPFGFAPLEANACGAPVVAVAEGGVRETVVDGVNGLIVEHDAAAMAAAIERLRDDPDYARQLGENGCCIVAERWSLEGAVDRLEKCLADILRIGADRNPADERATTASPGTEGLAHRKSN